MKYLTSYGSKTKIIIGPSNWIDLVSGDLAKCILVVSKATKIKRNS